MPKWRMHVTLPAGMKDSLAQGHRSRERPLLGIVMAMVFTPVRRTLLYEQVGSYRDERIDLH